MANIVISELRPAGSELFMDSESYLTDLNEQEMMDTLGGLYGGDTLILWSPLVCLSRMYS
jgi:hypothetical protein